MSEKLASIDDLFGPPKRRYVETTLPISKHRVRVRSLTEREVAAYHATLATLPDNAAKQRRDRLEDAARRLFVLCLVDGDGNPLLTDAALPRLADWDAADSAFLYDTCSKHVGLNRKDIEDLVKNSAATADGD